MEGISFQTLVDLFTNDSCTIEVLRNLISCLIRNGFRYVDVVSRYGCSVSAIWFSVFIIPLVRICIARPNAHYGHAIDGNSVLYFNCKLGTCSVSWNYKR